MCNECFLKVRVSYKREKDVLVNRPMLYHKVGGMAKTLGKN